MVDPWPSMTTSEEIAGSAAAPYHEECEPPLLASLNVYVQSTANVIVDTPGWALASCTALRSAARSATVAVRFGPEQGTSATLAAVGRGAPTTSATVVASIASAAKTAGRRR